MNKHFIIWLLTIVLVLIASNKIVGNNLNSTFDSIEQYIEIAPEISLEIAKSILVNPEFNKSQKQKAIFLIGLAFKNLQNTDSSLVYFQASINYFTTLDTLTREQAIYLSWAYNDIAEIHANISNLDKALHYNEKSININNHYRLETQEIKSLITKGKITYFLGSTDKAKVYWTRGYQLAISQNNTDLTGRLLNNLGSLFYHEKNWNKCIEYFKKALTIQKSINNEKEIVKAANNVGLAHFMKSEFKQAIPYFLQAEQLGKKHNMYSSQAMTFHYLVQAYLNLNNVKKTNEYFSKFELALEKVYGEEKQKTINELEVKYEVNNKNKEIELLEKQKIIDKLEFQQAINNKNKLLSIGAFLIILAAMAIWFKFQNYKKQQTINKQKLLFQKLETEQRMLRSQMNPHFIFNSLASIQSFISSENTIEAEKYLTRFSRLMRAILENSRQDTITLDQEIEMLQLYLDLEQMRFDNKFQFTFHLSPEIELNYIQLPPMLIQPFIENAILHGLKDEFNGRIDIYFKEENDTLICIVEDNGIGRTAAAKNKNASKHQSLATKITQERLNTLSKKTSKKATFEIIDKFDTKQNIAQGTKVILKIPLDETEMY